MTREENIERLNSNIANLQERITPLIKERDSLLASVQPTVCGLFSNIDKYATAKVARKKYRHILGGDGRSRAWDEERTGNVLSISLSGSTYLSAVQRKLVEEHFREVHEGSKIDHVEFV